MVSLKEMRAALATFKDTQTFVAVVVGGTSGIGECIVRAIAKYGSDPTIVIVGRNATAAEKIIGECQKLSPSAKFEFLAQDVSLLKGVDDVCEKIRDKLHHLDLLFMTPDYLSLAREGTSVANLGPSPVTHQLLSRNIGGRGKGVVPSILLSHEIHPGAPTSARNFCETTRRLGVCTAVRRGRFPHGRPGPEISLGNTHRNVPRKLHDKPRQ